MTTLKLLTLAALAATLLLPIAAEETKTPAPVKASAPNPDALTPAQAAKWKEINDSVKAATEAAERAELVYLRAEKARVASFTDANAALAKMQAEAKCPGCMPQAQPDGSLVWPRPVTENRKEK